MTNDIYDKANKIRNKLTETKSELKIFKEVIYKDGYVELIPSLGIRDYYCISHFVADYIKRDNIAAEIIKIMKEEIQKLEKEFEEL